MLQFLNWVLSILHLLLIGFNLLGWIWPRTRKLHLFIALATAFSWLGLGIWFGLGYCPLTDWHWQIKEQLGERNLPNSFIKYLADLITGEDTSADLVDLATATGFGAALIVSLILNLKKPGHHQSIAG